MLEVIRSYFSVWVRVGSEVDTAILLGTIAAVTGLRNRFLDDMPLVSVLISRCESALSSRKPLFARINMVDHVLHQSKQ